MKKMLFFALVILSTLNVTAQFYIATQRERDQRLNDLYCSGLFEGTHGTIIDLSDHTSVQSYLNILDWLQGRVAGLQIYTNRNGNRVPFIRGTQANIYLNEMLVDPGLLSMISVNDIAMIKVIKGPFAGGIGANGVVAVYTWRGGEWAE